MKETIKEWVHEPAFSNCIGFDPAAQITDGQVTINHIIEAPCQETVTFEVITNLDRRGSDTITINVG
jgi:hypothetical protein